MKKLNTNNAGRMPFWQADLDFIQQAYTEPIEALVNELGMSRDYFIITGCNVRTVDSGHTLLMTEGWFYWCGQILPVRELPKTDVSNFHDPMVRLTLVSYNNPDGARNFIHADLTTESVSDVWQDDYLTPTVVERSDTFNSGVRIGIEAWKLRDILKRYVGGCESGWIDSSYTNVKYKMIGKLVILKGTTVGSQTCSGLPHPELGLLPISYTDENNYSVLDQNGNLICQYNNGLHIHNYNGYMYIADQPYIQYVDFDTIVDEE